MDYNPYLQQAKSSGNTDANKGSVEKISEIKNFIWQTRTAPPTTYENQLGDLLEQVFVSGIEELPAVVAKLNEMGGSTPDGKAWTVENFQAVMRQLGKE